MTNLAVGCVKKRFNLFHGYMFPAECVSFPSMKFRARDRLHLVETHRVIGARLLQNRGLSNSQKIIVEKEAFSFSELNVIHHHKPSDMICSQKINVNSNLCLLTFGSTPISLRNQINYLGLWEIHYVKT